MKLNKQDKELIESAKKIIAKSKSVKLADTSDVGSSLITNKGHIYSGVSIGFLCGIDSCAEYQAIGTMISNGEKEIKTIVALSSNGRVLPSCGKCREMIKQASKKNWNTELIVSDNKKLKLKDLLPYPYKDTIEK